MTNNAPSKRKLAPKLLLALFASLFTLIALEVLARVYVGNFADREQFSKYASFAQYRERLGGGEWWFGLLTPHRYLGYTLAPNLRDGKNRHNAMGFRGEEITLPKPKGEFRIACVGASTTYSLLVPDHKRSYPALLQSNLRRQGHREVTVINAGVPGWTSFENLISYLIRVQPLKPDMMIFKEAFADVVCRLVWPPSAFKPDNSGCLAPRFALRQTGLEQASTLYRILSVESGLSLPASALGQSVYNQAPTSYFFAFAKQRYTGRYPSGIFEKVPVAKMLNANTSVNYRRNTEDMLRQALNRRVRVMVMTFPYTAEIHGYFDIDGFKQAVDEHNTILRDIAKKLGLPLLDLASIFPTDKAFWGFDGIHANEAGTELEAKLVADFILEHKLITHTSDSPTPVK